MSEVKSFTSNKPYLFRAILNWLLDNNSTPYILVDTTKANVDVPQEHIKDDQIVLNISPTAVQNWYVDKTALSFSARFSGRSRDIYVPMTALLAVYAQENGQGMAFPVQENELEQDEIDFAAGVDFSDDMDFDDVNITGVVEHTDKVNSDPKKSGLDSAESERRASSNKETQQGLKLKALSGEGSAKTPSKSSKKSEKTSGGNKSHLSVVK
jgi:stringent starvation protein B